MARIQTKPSMKNALQGSLQSEKQSFAARLAKADERLGDSTFSKELGLPAAEPSTTPVTKVIREAFTIPELEHQQIETLRTKLLSHAIASTKSEIVRAGLLLLSEADNETLTDAISRLERVKTGRPKGK